MNSLQSVNSKHVQWEAMQNHLAAMDAAQAIVADHQERMENAVQWREECVKHFLSAARDYYELDDEAV